MTLASFPVAADPLVTAIPLAFEAAPTDPFGEIALPRVGVPVSAMGVRQAHLKLLTYYHVPATAAQRTAAQRPIGKQLDTALQIVLDPTRWEIHAEYVTIIGSTGTHYRVTPAFCEGASWTSRSGSKSTMCKGSLRAAVGMCTHQLAVEYLRLAQVLDPIPMALVPTDTVPPLAQAEILGSELFAILGRIRVKQRKVADEDVDLLLSAEDQLITVQSGDGYGATSPAEVPQGALCTLSPAAFADLWSVISGDAAKDALSLTLCIQTDATGTGLLAVTGPGVQIRVACIAMPC